MVALLITKLVNISSTMTRVTHSLSLSFFTYMLLLPSLTTLMLTNVILPSLHSLLSLSHHDGYNHILSLSLSTDMESEKHYASASSSLTPTSSSSSSFSSPSEDIEAAETLAYLSRLAMRRHTTHSTDNCCTKRFNLDSPIPHSDLPPPSRVIFLFNLNYVTSTYYYTIVDLMFNYIISSCKHVSIYYI